MGEWCRRPSKAWSCEPPGLSAGRASSSSPGGGSQDSGFSDALHQQQRPTTPDCGVPAVFDATFSPLRVDTRLSWLTELEEPAAVSEEDCDSPDSRPEAEQSPQELQEGSLLLDCQPVCTSTPKSETPVVKPRGVRRPHNLLHDFNRSGSNADSVENSSVQCWLKELISVYEPECTTTLQSKSLAADLGRQVEGMAEVLSNAKLRHLQRRTALVSAELSKFCRQLDYGTLEHAGPLAQSLCGNVLEFCEEVGQVGEGFQRRLHTACERLRNAAARPEPDREQLAEVTAELGQRFTDLLDCALKQHTSALLERMENPPNALSLRAALSGLATLGLEGPGVGRIVAECGGVRTLLTVTIDSRSSSVRTAALRALAAVCCVAASIRQFEEAGGVEILADILADESRPEPELSEAAGVLAQITSPWVEDNHSIHGLAEHLPSLVKSLTRLANPCVAEETLLLVAAALANLSHLEPRCVWPLLDCATVGKLLEAVKAHGPGAPIFLREQAATLLANVAAVPETRPSLASQGAALALVCFLQVRACPLQNGAEIAAAERLQQKSAIALSRLCTDKAVAQEVVDLQGVTRLVRLCREDRERNHSDGVLVACLAALRKIAANCGTKVIADLEATELVEPRLLDSFLLYSSRQESYV